MAGTEDLVAWDRHHLWHPFTQMQDWAGSEPIVVESGEGSWLVDSRGRRWLDGVGSIWTNVHGHRKRELDEALVVQVGKIAHSTLLGLSNAPAAEFSKRLVDACPRGDRGGTPTACGSPLTRVFYSDNGATSVEVALKMAFQYWQHVGEPKRRRFVHLAESYHGDTIGAVSVGGIDLFHTAYKPLLFDTIAAPNPNPLRPTCGETPERCVAGCTRALEKIFAEHGREIAAMVVEPRVQGSAGIVISPPSYLKRARELCDEYGALLIVDEVATGFGRTGPMWACESAGVLPDLMCAAKGISGGYLPLAATIATEKVYAAFLGPYEAQKTFFHGHTYTGNPLACAVAIASLKLFETERILERSKARIAHLAKRLGSLADHPHVAEIRQAGFLVGIELVPERRPVGEVPPAYPWEQRRGVRACFAARDQGVFLRPLGNVVVLNPPLSISDSEIDLLVRAAQHGIEVATAAAA